MTPVFEDPPVLCGHRGNGRGDGENTLAGYRAAVAAGLTWVEVDARLAADGVLVANHDPVLADGRAVADVPAAESGLMRLTDLFEALPPEIAVDIDVKSALEDALRPRGQTTAARVADLAARQRRRLLVTSFDPAALPIVRERAPGVPVGLLTWMGFPLRKAIAAAAHLGAAVVAPHVDSFDLEPAGAARAVAVAHEAGLQVAAWCPTPDQRQRLIQAAVDCLVVDDVTGTTAPRSPAGGPAGEPAPSAAAGRGAPARGSRAGTGRAAGRRARPRS